MTGCEFGEVVLVRFPFTDLLSSKRRPAVVISSRLYNQVRPDVLILAITSQPGSAAHLDAPLGDWKQAGLLKPSVLKPAIATVQKDLLYAKVGRLSEADLRGLRSMLELILGAHTVDSLDDSQHS
jgi:mRNA interferase MazF